MNGVEKLSEPQDWNGPLHPDHPGHRRRGEPERRPALDGDRPVRARRAAELQLHAERAGRGRRPGAPRAVADRRRAARGVREVVAAGQHPEPPLSALSAADLHGRARAAAAAERRRARDSGGHARRGGGEGRSARDDEHAAGVPGAARSARALGRGDSRAAGAGRGRLERVPRQPRERRACSTRARS